MAKTQDMVKAGLFITQAQAISGDVGAVTAGTTQTQAGATPVTTVVCKVTTGTANDGVILPVVSPGDEIVIQNTSGANALKVYPPVGGAINGGSANAAVTLATSTVGRYRAVSAVDYIV